jgi:hypothetical protein
MIFEDAASETDEGDLRWRTLSALQHLIRSSHLNNPDDLPAIVAEATARLGAIRSELYVVDYDQIVLVPLGPSSGEEGSSVAIDTTLPGRSYRDVTTQLGSADDGRVVWIPVIDGAERLGVLEVVFPPVSKSTCRCCRPARTSPGSSPAC